MSGFNAGGVWAIYRYELSRTVRTIWQSVATPVITTALYFVVFGSAIGSRMSEVGGVSYGAFIVPGLIMLSLLTQSISNASIGIYFPKFTGTIFEILSAPLSPVEAVTAYVGAATTKSVGIGLVILLTATLFVPVRIDHPLWMAAFLILTSVAFSLFGFIIGIWAKNFEQLAVIPALIVTHFIVMSQLGLVNTLAGVVGPQLIAPVTVIIYKQFFDSVPKDFREAAVIDGASEFQLLSRIYLPVNWGVTTALAIITFIGAWNLFLWPFLAVSSEEKMNITVGITQVHDAFGVSYGRDLAVAMLAAMPVAVIYLIFQRRVTQAIMLSAGIKG